MDNQSIAKIFEEIGNILEIQNQNPFRFKAYYRAAQTIENLSQELSEIYKADKNGLTKIPGIGRALADTIIEILETGKSRGHDALVKTLPEGFLNMLDIRGVGPKKVKLFYTELAVKNIVELKEAAEKRLLQTLPGMGEKSESEILAAINEYLSTSHDRRLLFDAMQQADEFVAHLGDGGSGGKNSATSKLIEAIEPCGSLRRRAETVGDIDILCASKNPEKIMERYVSYPEIAKILSQGSTKSSVVLKSGIQVDLRVIDKESFGAALQYFTGSKEHNVRTRDIAKRKGLKLSEYGVFDNDKMIAGKTEKEVYNAIGLPFIPPEMRENRGEIELAEKLGVKGEKNMPKLIELKDLRGDLHVHSDWSDASQDIETVAMAYKKAGFDYIAMTDHSAFIGITHGMDENRIKQQWKEIDKLNKKLAPFKILKGCEVDIHKDGTLALPDEILKKLDIVIVAVHSAFTLPEPEQTARIIKALKNPYVKILAHPSGRLINKRPAYKVDMDAIIKTAVENDVALEINSSPSRMDLQDIYVKRAKELGAKFAINSDSHHSSHMEYLKFGVFVARKGWLEAKNVINTMPIS
ncbi:MAG: family X DNA polymerase IV, DNA polymerase (family X) [Candidatus Peregrinibacteria bacterium GW2011_GWF2_38_29]|nr:MAG: family X DNA polymerase IV, DNA polymerase (family X) [Candidatus Peregrinibacteria bacterium GW2011_GWF2_38_29]HBB02609.1 DNA polymerase/3'-5' exonuclease PolX [Candidatus Peregrinibacteria bacterium]